MCSALNGSINATRAACAPQNTCARRGPAGGRFDMRRPAPAGFLCARRSKPHERATHDAARHLFNARHWCALRARRHSVVCHALAVPARATRLYSCVYDYILLYHVLTIRTTLAAARTRGILYMHMHAARETETETETERGRERANEREKNVTEIPQCRPTPRTRANVFIVRMICGAMSLRLGAWRSVVAVERRRVSPGGAPAETETLSHSGDGDGCGTRPKRPPAWNAARESCGIQARDARDATRVLR